MAFEVEIVLLHAHWAKRNAGKGTPAKCNRSGERQRCCSPIPVFRNIFPKTRIKVLDRPGGVWYTVPVKKAATACAALALWGQNLRAIPKHSSLIELRFCVNLARLSCKWAAAFSMPNIATLWIIVWRCIHYRYRWKVEGTGDQRSDP